MLFFDNYNSALSVNTDLSDLARRWFFMIQIHDEQGNKHVAYPAIFSSFAFRKNERVQIVNGFNEVSHLYAFGKNPDQIQLGGHILSSNIFNFAFTQSSRALTDHYNQIMRAFAAASAGLRTVISGPAINSKGGTILKGISTDMGISMNGAINSVMDFTLNFVEVDSVMGVGGSTDTSGITKSGSFNILF